MRLPWSTWWSAPRSLEVELAATLHLLGQRSSLIARCATWSRGLPRRRVAEIIELGLRHRGRHDEALRAFHAGAALRFDILMDIGGFRDMHRHRRCVQIMQGFTARARLTRRPGIWARCGWPRRSRHPGRLQGRDQARRTPRVRTSPRAPRPKPPLSALYLLPLATRVRCLFKMDFAEAQYISELRSGAGRPLQLSARRVGDVSGPRAPASDAGQAHSRHRLHRADRSAAAVKLR